MAPVKTNRKDSTMNKKTKIILLAIMPALIAVVAGAARLKIPESVVNTPQPVLKAGLPELENQIPFELEEITTPAPGVDYFELDVIVQLDETGRESVYTWRAMDGETVLLECADFYDLYYMCDGPSEFKVRVITRDEAGRQTTVRQGFLAMN
jgi:hypothetical protein